MAEIVQSKKALAVNPLKVSQPVGASLAFLGLGRSLPLMHGSQGCTAFGKVFFVRHFREPIPLQTTAMDQVASIMGADDNVVEGLRVLSEKSKPDVIGLVTTGLSETQGTDIHRAVRDFREKYPDVPIIATGGPTDETILAAINAGANAISWTPPSNGELFRRKMEKLSTK